MKILLIIKDSSGQLEEQEVGLLMEYLELDGELGELEEGFGAEQRDWRGVFCSDTIYDTCLKLRIYFLIKIFLYDPISLRDWSFIEDDNKIMNMTVLR